MKFFKIFVAIFIFSLFCSLELIWKNYSSSFSCEATPLTSLQLLQAKVEASQQGLAVIGVNPRFFFRENVKDNRGVSDLVKIQNRPPIFDETLVRNEFYSKISCTITVDFV